MAVPLPGHAVLRPAILSKSAGPVRNTAEFSARASGTADSRLPTCAIEADEAAGDLGHLCEAGIFYGCCRSVHEFEIQAVIGEGTYGRVWRAYDKRLDMMVALKQMRLLQQHSSKEGFPRTAVREIGLLRQLQHPNIVELLEIVCGPDLSSSAKYLKSKNRELKDQQPYTGDKTVYLVFEHCERDLGVLLDARAQPFTPSQVKSLMKQLLMGLHHLHSNFIIHRDVKLSNILISAGGCVKLADFGLTRIYCEPRSVMSDGVVTLWYRAPELLLGASTYDEKIDMWAVGCIFGELLANRPFIPGRTEQEQLILMCDFLGTPDERQWPSMKSLRGYTQFKLPTGKVNKLGDVFKKETPNCLNLLNCLLSFDPARRISARDALLHPYFVEQPLMSCMNLLSGSVNRSSRGKDDLRKTLVADAAVNETCVPGGSSSTCNLPGAELKRMRRVSIFD